MNIKKFPIDSIGYVELVDTSTKDIGLKVVNSARISYAKSKEAFDDKDKKLTRRLWEDSHTSPFRHSWFTFHIKAPLIVFRQWMKYQVASYWRSYEINGEDAISAEVLIEAIDLLYDLEKGCSWNEVSGRYVVLTPEFYTPITFRSNAGHTNKQASSNLPWSEGQHISWGNYFTSKYNEMYEAYKEALKTGIAKEQARLLLPQSIYTQAYWTVSLQSILWFIEQRTKEGAQWEIRQYALAIQEIIEPYIKNLNIEPENV